MKQILLMHINICTITTKYLNTANCNPKTTTELLSQHESLCWIRPSIIYSHFPTSCDESDYGTLVWKCGTLTEVIFEPPEILANLLELFNTEHVLYLGVKM